MQRLAVLASIFGAVASLAFRGRRLSPRLRSVTALGLVVGVAGVALLAHDEDSRAAEGFTVNISPKQVDVSESPYQIWNTLYADTKAHFEGLQATSPPGETTLVYSKETGAKMLGLPALQGEAGTATAYFDDAEFDLTVKFQTTYLNQTVEVLVSARWPDSTSFEPELAVVLRVGSVDLQALSPSFSAFSVRFSDAIVGFANVDHTLVESIAMGTDGFFEDGIADANQATPDNTFHILPGGAALQAALHDEPNEPDPMVEAAGLLGAVDTIVIRGTAGKIAGDSDDDPATKALDITASVVVSTPPSLQGTGVTLDQTWSLQVKGEKSGETLTFFGQLSGKAKLNLDGKDYEFTAALTVTYDKATKKADFKLEGAVGDLDDVFGQSWLDLKQFKVSAGVSRDASKTPPETTVSMGMTAKLTINNVALVASLTTKVNATTGQVDVSASFVLDNTSNTVGIAGVLSALGSPQVHSDLQVTLTSFGLHVGVKKTSTATTLTVVATGGASLLARTCGTTNYPAGTASLLFRVEIGGATTPVLVGASVSGLNTKNLSCDIPFEWSLPNVLLMVSTADVNTPWTSADSPTKTFLETYFCGGTGTTPLCNSLQRVICPAGSTIPCVASSQVLKVDTGLTLHALVTLDADLKKALSELSINVDGSLRVTGKVPLFGSTGLSLAVALPTITTANADAIVASADVLLKIEAGTEGVEAEIAGTMGFRVQRPNQTTCTAADAKFSNNNCYDLLTLSVAIGIEAKTTPTPSVKLSVSAFLSNWVNAFGEPNLTIENFAIELTIQAQTTPTPGATITVGMRGNLDIGGTDLTIAFLVEFGSTPPRILLKGLTVGTAKGIALRDIVKTFAPDLDEEALPPELSLKNIWFAYGTETNNTLCIRQGLFISAELHLNDPDPGNSGGTNPACGGNGVPPLNCGAGTSCLAGIRVDIGPKKFFLQGTIAAFNFGPLAFQQTDVLIDLSLIKQEISFKGGATLYDPVLWYAAEPDGTGTIPVWASAFVRLEVKQNLGAFSVQFTGCALLGGTAQASADCPTSSTTVLKVYLDASLTVDFKKVGLKFFEDAEVSLTVNVSAPALQQLVKDIEAGLQPVATFFDDAGAAVEGTATEVVNDVETHFCLAFNVDCPDLNVTADAYTNAPAYIDGEINATDSAIDNSTAVDFYCFFQVGIPTTPCVDGFRNQARMANENTIAANGGRLYIALHGINATGFGGIRDATFPDIWYVNPTTFDWPAGDEKALCEQGGALAEFDICDIPKGQPLVLDDVIGPALLEALRQLDPEVVALFAVSSSQSQVTAAGALSLAQTAGVTPSEFVAAVKKLGAAFDLGKPLGVCESKATFTLKPTGLEGTTEFQTKVDAYGGKAIVSAAPVIGGGKATLDQKAVKTGVVTDVLVSAVSDVGCPVTTPAGVLSFSMSAATIDEGNTLTLTGKATGGATVTVDWGDDSTDSTATADEDGDWTASHKYVDGPKVRGIKATSAGAPDATSLVSVNNVAPNIVSLTAPGDANEGGEVTLTGTYTDPGTLDTHVVSVTWGDGTSSQMSLAAGAGSFSLKHKYVDDNPTGTAQDMHTIGITITDKDKGTDTDSTSALVKNVAPYDLRLDSASWAGGTAARDADGNLVVPEGTAVTFSGTFRDPGAADTHLVSISWNGGQVLQGVTATPDASDPTLKRFTVDRVFADDHPATGTSSDLVQVKLQVRDDDTGTASADLKVRVENVAPTATVAPASQDVQYSDPIAKVTLTASDVQGFAGAGGSLSETLQVSTRWKVDDGDWQDGLFGDLSWSVDGCELSGIGGTARQTCKWSIEGLVHVAPGNYVIELTVVDDDTGSTTKTVVIEVLPEDARATYTGPTLVSAPSLADGWVEVMLRATVRDISVVPGMVPADEYPGDITNATLTFVDREGETLCVAEVVPIFVGNTTTGGASCVATLVLPPGASIDTIDVGLVVGGWYLRDDASEDAAVTIEKPAGDWVTGGDAIVNLGGPGTKPPAGDADVNVSTSWKTGFTELSGKLRIRFESGGRMYELSVTSFDSVGTRNGGGGKSGAAQIEARATLFDITTSTDNPITLATGLRLQFRLTDDASKADTASFAAWASDGLLVAASGWNGVLVPETALRSGKLQVHFD